MRSPSILITEDETITAMDIKEKLESYGYAVAGIASSGRDALNLAGHEKPDLILMDIVIQGDMDGILTAKLARERFDIPVIFLTAHADRTTLEKARQAVPYGYIVKPFKDEELFSVVEMALHKHDMEYKLRESERKYRELVELANSIIIRMDPEGNITFFNEYAQRFFGYSCEEAQGRNVVGLIVPEYDSWGNDLHDLIRDIGTDPERYSTNENENMKKGGERVWISWNNRAVFDADGALAEILCIGMDMTRRKVLEEHLRHSEEKFSKTFMSSPDPVLITTIDRGIILDVNEAMIEKTGFSRNELIGSTTRQINIWPDYSIRERSRESIEQTGAVRNVEIEFRLRNGVMHALYSAVRIEIEGQPCILSIARDVTELRKADAERREALQRMNDIIEFLPDATFVVDNGGRIIEWNRAMEKMFFTPKSAVLGMDGHDASEIFYGEKRPLLVSLIDRPDPSIESIYENFRRDGSIIYAETFSPTAYGGSGAFVWIKASPFLDTSGAIVGAIETIRDITQLKNTETALKESEQKFRLLFEQSEDPQLIIENNVFIDCNSSALSLYGLERKGDLIGKHPSDVAPEHQPDGGVSHIMERNHLTQALRRGSISYEWTIYDAHRREIPIEITLTAISMHGKKLFHAACRDITVRKRFERELRESEEKYRTIFETSGTAMIIFDDSMTIRLLNRRMEQLTGIKRREIEGRRKWTDFIADTDIDMLKKYHKLSVRSRGSGPSQVEFSYVTGSGEIRECYGNFARIPGTDLRVGSIIDVTDYRRLTRQILQISSDEQQRIGRDLHDGLGQHLTGIAFLSKVLEKKLREKNLAERADATKITELINSAIDTTRSLSKGLTPVSLEQQGLDDALEDLAMQTSDLFGIRCAFSCRHPINLTDKTAALHVYYIVREAVNNAVKHSGAKSIEISFTSNGDMITFSVQDDGRWLDRADSPRKGDQHRGLGLSLMQYRADMIGASFELRKSDRGGTVISCSFRNRK
jgi:PAS domain S-box-containing protein